MLHGHHLWSFVVITYFHLTYQRLSNKSIPFQDILNIHHYDKRLHPSEEDKPVEVMAQVYVAKITNINERTFDYEISYFLRLWWNDYRVSWSPTGGKRVSSMLPLHMIWTPDVQLANSNNYENVGKSNIAISNYKGDVYLCQRMHAVVNCEMELRNYPMDTQYCPFILESFNHDTKEVRLMWHKQPVQFQAGMKLSGYNLTGSITKRFTIPYNRGGQVIYWDNLVLKFVIARELAEYIYQFYIPSVLLMVFNVGSYWVPDSALPARITLLVTTFLTNALILRNIGHKIRSTTTTSLHIFIVVNIVFIVGAMVEYMLLLWWKSRKVEPGAIIIKETPEDEHCTETRLFNGRKGSKKEEGEENKENVQMIDLISRIVAPTVYVVFICVYFAYYLVMQQVLHQ